ncbi:MAG TPA: glycosyltransferase family 4 protein [Pyrinomonadaceae bacterium]|nr:glycosyltransferase family 4 protein [Pyrinomonadaceae bacterium]
MPTVVSVFGVQPIRIGGTETFARELSLQLGQKGWKSVLCFESEPSEEVANCLSLPNVTLEVLKDPTDFNWAATKQLASILRRYRADILHLHFTGFVGAFPWLARVLSVKKVFFTDHSSRQEKYVPARAPFWKRWLVRLINYPITKVICVSKYGCHCAQTLDLLPADRFQLVYNGVDLSRVNDSGRSAEFRRHFKIPDNKKIVVQVSWIIPEKGIGDLLEVAKLVTAKRTNVQFVIVGDGPFRGQYRKQANDMGLGDVVTWTGLMKDPFHEGVYEAADIVCQLSRWEEVFGWMISEAMAFGKPVVATRVGGIPELVAEGETGFLVNRADVNAAAERVLSLLDDAELRKTLGRTGRQKTERKFNLQTNITELLHVYGI